ncbi:MAG: hypothetical protein HOC74_02955 [Gemmatimonadetes bacterium]|mgnify:FL=1|jgi:hypothetical protein|nr:hypothetical protein [Gemmatimonadota bacterium]
METKPITIRVSPEAARIYEAAPTEQQRKLDALLSLKLSEVSRSAKPLEEIMSQISQKAQERGMTPEILEAILSEE